MKIAVVQKRPLFFRRKYLFASIAVSLSLYLSISLSNYFVATRSIAIIVQTSASITFLVYADMLNEIKCKVINKTEIYHINLKFWITSK